MIWTIRFERTAAREFRKLDVQAQRRIRDYLAKRVIKRDHPRELGKALRARTRRLWRYRVGPYRVVCELRDEQLLVLVVRIGHRREIYD